MRGYSIRTEEVTRIFKLEIVADLSPCGTLASCWVFMNRKVLGSAYNLNLFNYIWNLTDLNLTGPQSFNGAPLITKQITNPPHGSHTSLQPAENNKISPIQHGRNGKDPNDWNSWYNRVFTHFRLNHHAHILSCFYTFVHLSNCRASCEVSQIIRLSAQDGVPSNWPENTYWTTHYKCVVRVKQKVRQFTANIVLLQSQLRHSRPRRLFDSTPQCRK